MSSTEPKFNFPEPVRGHEDWMWDAKCYGQDPKGWFTDNHPSASEKRCDGCPFSVMQKCAQRALHYQDIGVWAAGVPLASDRYTNEETGRYAVLEKIAAGEHATFQGKDLQITLDICANDELSKLPKANETHSAYIDGFEYVSPAGAGVILGWTPEYVSKLALHGKIPLTVRYVRIHATGNPSVFYLADEARRIKEKRDAERNAKYTPQQLRDLERRKLAAREYRARLKQQRGEEALELTE